MVRILHNALRAFNSQDCFEKKELIQQSISRKSVCYAWSVTCTPTPTASNIRVPFVDTDELLNRTTIKISFSDDNFS